jgi:protein-tyrosine phosphatase
LPTLDYICNKGLHALNKIDSDTKPALKVLMVCLGNICRSPLAQGILEHKAASAGLHWEVDSAGTLGFHNGEPPHPLSRKVALLNGIDIGGQVSRPFVAEDLARFDLIYAMSADVLEGMYRIGGEMPLPPTVKLLMDECHPGKRMDVPDPWSESEEAYHKVYEMIGRACDALIAKQVSKNSIARNA